MFICASFGSKISGFQKTDESEADSQTRIDNIIIDMQPILIHKCIFEMSVTPQKGKLSVYVYMQIFSLTNDELALFLNSNHIDIAALTEMILKS